jgi:hypothetical protein
MATFSASYYRARAEEMRRMAEKAQSESQRLTFLRLEASWLRLADQAEKPPAEGGDGDGAESN